MTRYEIKIKVGMINLWRILTNQNPITLISMIMRLVLTSDWPKIDFQVQTEDDSYDESDSYETMSDGLAELLGL